MKFLCVLSLALAGIAYGQTADKPIQLEMKDFTPEQAAKLHARVCAHGPTHFCGPLISKTGTEQEQSAIVPKDAKSGHYCMWIEYDGGETELRQCFDVDESAPKQDPAKPAGQKKATFNRLGDVGINPAQRGSLRIARRDAAFDPIDMPAIQETRKVPKDQCRIATPATGVGIFTSCLPEEKVVTCAEKTRILEHDEQNPAKYWCRKVQP